MNKMNELLTEFECIVILKTIIFDVDLNFIGENDLDKIIQYANDMGIELDCSLYETISYPNSDNNTFVVYKQWKEDIYKMYEEVKEKLLKEL